MALKSWQKTTLSMLLIVGAGLVLSGLAFILAALVQSVFIMLVMPQAGDAENARSIAQLWHLVYLVLIVLLSWLIFRLRLNDLIKAAFLTMPLMVIFSEIGIWLYATPVLVYVAGAVFLAAVLVCLYLTKRSWLYYFATFVATALMLIVMLTGMEI